MILVHGDVVEYFHFTEVLSCDRSILCPVKPD